LLTFEIVVTSNVHNQLNELAATASALGGEAVECATGASGEVPLWAAYLFRSPSQLSGWHLLATGTIFDLVLLLAGGVRGLVRRLQRRPDPIQIAACYRDRIEVLTWKSDLAGRDSPDVVQHMLGGRLIYVGNFTVRIGGAAWGISELDRDALVAVMLRTAWQPQLVRVG